MIQYYFLDFFGCATLACIADHLYLQLGLSHRIESMIGVEACWTGKTFQCVFSLRIWVRNRLVIHVMAAARGCCTCLQDTSRPVSVYGCILFWKSTFPKTRRGLMAAVVQACPSLHSRPRRFARSSSTGAIGRTETAAPSGQPRRLRRTKTRVWFQFVICFELFILFIIINYLSFLWYIYIYTLGNWFAPENTPDLQMSRRDRLAEFAIANCNCHSMGYKLCTTPRKDSLFPTKLTGEDTLGIHWDVLLDIFRYRQMPLKGPTDRCLY